MTLLTTDNYKIERLNRNTIRITSKDKVTEMSMKEFEQKLCNHGKTKSIDSETVACVYCGKIVSN